MTSSNGNIFRVTGHLCGEFTGPGEQRPVTRNFDVFFDLRLNKRLSKQSWGWWFQNKTYYIHDSYAYAWFVLSVTIVFACFIDWLIEHLYLVIAD